MNREKLLKTVWPILIIILVLIWARALKGTGSRRPSEQSKDTSVVALPGGTGIGPAAFDASSQPKKSSYEDWGKNPFVFSSGVSQNFILEGILWDINKPAAIISGEIVGKGDPVGSYVVVDVQQDRVILNDGEKDIELRLEKEE